MAADVTRDQLIEFVNKMSREQIALLTKVANGDITREDLQQMITQSKRDPKERLARSLLKRAQSPMLAQSDQNIIGWSEIAASYELLGDHDMAEKIGHVIDDKALRKELIKNGTNQVQWYSWKKMAKETHGVYTDALNK